MTETLERLAGEVVILLQAQLTALIGAALATLPDETVPEHPSLFSASLADDGAVTIQFTRGFGWDIGPTATLKLFPPQGRRSRPRLHVVPPDDPDGPTAA